MICNNIQTFCSASSRSTLPRLPAVASYSGFARRAQRCRGFDELAAAFATRDRGVHKNRAGQHVCASANRSLSFNQRWRSFKSTADEQAAKAQNAITSLPPVQALTKALQVLQQKLEPFYRFLTFIRKWWAEQLASYAEFGGEETKRQWEWKRRTEAERSLWVSIGQFLGMSLLTAFWEAITPVSIFWGAFLPLFLAWILYDRPYLSPIVVTLVLMSPFKFPPGYNVKLI